MSLVNSSRTKSTGRLFALYLGILIISGCSGSSEPQPADGNSEVAPAELTAEESLVIPDGSDDIVSDDPGNEAGISTTTDVVNQPANDSDAMNGAAEDSSTSDVVVETSDTAQTETPLDVLVPETTELTRINFDIAVPAYQSDSLQVRLQWGDVDVYATFVVDESWAVAEDFAVNSENMLIVTFYDGNGAIILGTFEQVFRTEYSLQTTFQITANQFDTARWDADSDGNSNLDELLTGSDPLVEDISLSSPGLQELSANLRLVPDKTVQIAWELLAGMEVYRVFENPDGRSGFVQIGDDLDESATEFNHRVALYERFNAQYFVQACDERGRCVDSEELFVSGSLDQAVGYLKASNTGQEDGFGGSISLSNDGNTMVVGAPGEASSATGVNGLQTDDSLLRAGAAYVFERVADQWQQKAYLKASNAGERDGFGAYVSLSANGKILAVAAPNEASALQEINGDETDNSAVGAGAIYVFELVDSQWVQTHYIKASNGSAIAYLGVSVQLSADGNTLVSKGNYSTTNGPYDTVYIFDRDGDSWQETRIESSQTSTLFGADGLALSDDGNTLAIGDPRRHPPNDVLGSVHVYVRGAEGWRKQASLRGDNLELGDNFGIRNSIDISADGSTLVVGAHLEAGASTGVNNRDIWNENASYHAGAAYVFQRYGESWQQQAFLKAGNTDAEDQFGISASISAAGDTLVVGAYRERGGSTGINGDATDNSLPATTLLSGASGAAYVFKLVSGEWNQQAYVKATNPDATDFFGQVLALSGDGKTLAVGALEDSAATGFNGDQVNNSVRNSGAVYLY